MADRGIDYLEGAEARVRAAVDACTECGACFDACPMPAPAGLEPAARTAAVGGLIALLKGGAPTPASAAWTAACCGSNYCRDACPEGLDVRFMQRMGKIAQQARTGDPREIKQRSVKTYNAMAASVRAIGGLLTDPDDLKRLGDGRPVAASASAAAPAEVTFYTGCNVWKTPHIVLTALDALDAVGVTANVMGGPGMCCGVYAFNQGDAKVSGRQAFGTVEKLAASAARETLSWCPSCQIQIGDLALGNWRAVKGETPFDMNPFFGFLASRIEALRPSLQPIRPRRVALIERPAIPGAMAAVRMILGAIPGVMLVDLDVRPAGVMENTLAVLTGFRSTQRAALLEGAAAAQVDVLATVYHACHRELCLYDDGQPFEVMNVMSLLGEALGKPREDRYKALKALGSVDAVIAEVAPDAAARGIDLDLLRSALAADMFATTPLATPPR